MDWLGKKYDDLSRKSMNLKGERWKNGGKGKIFIVQSGKNNILKRGGQKYHILGKYTPLIPILTTKVII